MGSCNTTQNERGGKDLLLKICETLEAASIAIGTGDDPQAILKTAHGLAVGDLVRFTTAELGTISDVTAGTLYYVKSVTANSFKISASPGGTAITFTSADADIDIEVFKTIGGLRSPGFSFASEAIDISNHGTNQWRKIKDGAGFRSASISGSGVYTSAANYKTMEASAFANELVCLAFVDVAGGRIYNGCFKITSLEVTGEYDGEGTYSLSAESSEEITISQAS